MSSSEIPGVFKVGDKRGVRGNKSGKRLKVSLEELREDPKIDLRHRNFLEFQNNREVGETAGVQAIKEFYRMKTSHTKKAPTSNISLPFIYDSCEVDFIIGNGETFFGTWCVDNGHKKNYAMGEISYNMNIIEGNVLQNYKPCKKIIDACSVPTDFITICKNSPSFIDIFGVEAHFQKPHLPPWYCCCFHPRYESVLVGGDGYVMTVTLDEPESTFHTKYPGRVYTLSHLPPSTRLLGLDTGEIWFMDPRDIRPFNYSIKISDEAVNDSIFLNDQEAIVTNAKDKLVTVDLRSRKISTIFYGHKHSATKRPFSVANDMLCATGADNVVRIWHTSAGGHPIHVQKPNSTHEVRGWLHAEGNKTYLNYFERDTRTVFTI